MAAVEDLAYKTGCCCILVSLYGKFPDCLGFNIGADICCLSQTCRLAFPMSIITCMGQFFCLDVRCALPCDASKVPITVGVLGLLCIDLDRKRLCGCCTKYQRCHLDEFLPCCGPACCGFDESKFEWEPGPITMNGRSEVFSKDTEGNYIVIRKPTHAESWHFSYYERKGSRKHELQQNKESMIEAHRKVDHEN